MTAADSIRDVGDADFDAEVIERSKTLPVVADFWAPWCGPCRVLGPVLERLAKESEGAFVLAKIDVDQAPETARALGIRSVPSVIGFRDGKPVSEFQGAQPEPAVRRFIEALLPSEADRLAGEATELAAQGHAQAAEERFRAALDADAHHAPALLGLATQLGEQGEIDAALDLLAHVPARASEAADAERLAATLRTRRTPVTDTASLLERVDDDPTDLGARLALGRGLAAEGRHEEALDTLLEAVRQDRDFDDEAARKAMLDLFEMLGSDHPLTQRFRAELARALFR